jgi:hypothetical protein
MTTIGVDTSPLQAAREWRGITMVAAALNAGLTAGQVEALENGEADAFSTTDEMIAAAVVYGASLGIGRDEAVALLDRSMFGNGVEVEIHDRPAAEPESAPTTGSRFTEAVRERSARIAERAAAVVKPTPSIDLPLEPFEPFDGSSFAVDPVEFDGPTPEQAVEASQEIHLGDHLTGGHSPWGADDEGIADDDEASLDMRDMPQGELETWVADRDPSSFGSAPAGSIATTRWGSGMHGALERLVGTDRADATMDWLGATSERVATVARTGRERLRQSEHATLIVAIGGGAILIALLVAIGGALSGGDDAKQSSAGSTTATTTASTAATPASKTPAKVVAKKSVKPAARPAMLPPAKLSVDVMNAGHQKGIAHRTADQLKAAHFRIGEVGNYRNSGYTQSTVLYRSGLDREAKALAKRLGITATRVAPGSSGSKLIVVTV